MFVRAISWLGAPSRALVLGAAIISIGAAMLQGGVCRYGMQGDAEIPTVRAPVERPMHALARRLIQRGAFEAARGLILREERAALRGEHADDLSDLQHTLELRAATLIGGAQKCSRPTCRADLRRVLRIVPTSSSLYSEAYELLVAALHDEDQS